MLMLKKKNLISNLYTKKKTKQLKKIYFKIFNNLKKKKFNFFNLYFKDFKEYQNQQSLKKTTELFSAEQNILLDYQTDLIFFYEKIFFKNFLEQKYLYNLKSMYLNLIFKKKKLFIYNFLYTYRLNNLKKILNNNYTCFLNEIKYLLFKLYISFKNNTFFLNLNKKKLSIFESENNILKHLDQLDISDKDKIIKLYNKNPSLQNIVKKNYLYNISSSLLIKKNTDYFFEEISSTKVFLKYRIIYMKSNHKFFDKKYYNKISYSNKLKFKSKKKDYKNFFLALEYNFEFYYSKKDQNYILTIYKQYNVNIYSIILNLGNLSLDLLLLITKNLKKRNIINLYNIININYILELLDNFIKYNDDHYTKP